MRLPLAEAVCFAPRSAKAKFRAMLATLKSNSAALTSDLACAVPMAFTFSAPFALVRPMPWTYAPALVLTFAKARFRPTFIRLTDRPPNAGLTTLLAWAL